MRNQRRRSATCSNCESDQRLCFRYTYSTIPLLPKSAVSSFLPSSVAVQDGLCQTSSELPQTGFLTSRLIFQLYLGHTEDVCPDTMDCGYLVHHTIYSNTDKDCTGELIECFTEYVIPGRSRGSHSCITDSISFRTKLYTEFLHIKIYSIK